MAATLSSPSLLNSPNRTHASFSPNPKRIQLSPPLTVVFSSQKLASPLSLRANRRTGAGGPDRARRHLVVTNAVRKLGESEEIPLAVSGEIVVGQVPSQSGIYAVYDKEGTLQFIGISRNISASVSTHLKTVPQLCNSLKVVIVEEQDRTSLVDAWKSWMEEHLAEAGNVPPGNESGNNTWVRQPAKAKPDLRLTPGRGKELTVPLEELIDKLVKEIEVVAFIKGSRNAPQCGFSQRVIGILNSHGVEYECVNVLDEEYNFGLRETLKKYSNWPTFPQIFVKGELLGGADILTSMAEKGELSALFKK